ncbi:MAG: hypothetical protein KAU90_05860 [Sulfurovaceae bacterium]|nr:hypothetical protein [Sulfurovaceae bacterium]
MNISRLILFCSIFTVTSWGASAKNGASLFEGTKPFKNGGVACVTCHNVNSPSVISGGTLAHDLTYMGGAMGAAIGSMVAQVDAMPSPIMTATYRGHELTKDERADISSFFVEKVDPKSKDTGLASLFWLFGLIGAGGIFGGLTLLGRKRVKNKSVNHEIYERQMKTKWRS